MKQSRLKRHDIILLLCVLLVFSCGISLLYGTATQEHAVSPVEDTEVFKDLQALDISHSVQKMGEFLARRKFEQQIRILNQILNGQTSALNPEEKVELGIELLTKRANISDQKTILDMLRNYPGVHTIPLMYIAVDKRQLSAVPMIVNYYKNNTQELHKTIYEALVHAIRQNNLKNFAQIISSVGGISAQMATQLLWEVLQQNKDAQFIPVLVKQKADVNNAKEGKTPLISAVDANNVEMVQMLLDHGAQPNKFVDPAIGTPLQRVQKLQRESKVQNATIELLLRDHGARE